MTLNEHTARGRGRHRVPAGAGAWVALARGSRLVPALHVLAAVSLGAGLAFPTVARAYRTAGDLPEFGGQPRVRWEAASIQLDVLQPSLPTVDAEAAEAGTLAAVAVLNDLDCGVVKLELVAGAAGPAAAGDGRNTIEWVGSGWVERGFSPSAAATTDVQYRRVDGSWEVAGADLFVNAELFSWGVDGRDPQAVLVHEILHLIGILHVCEHDGGDGAPVCAPAHLESAAHPDYLGLSQRSLGPDDIAGACFLYEREAGCATDDDCAPGLSCGDAGCAPACGADCECRADADCAAGRCEAGACVEARALGDPCAVHGECGSRVCHDDGYCTATCGASCPEGFGCEPASDAQCTAERVTYGAACEHGADCSGGLCVSGSWFAAMCTRTCAAGTCPGLDTCEVVDGRAVCTPPREGGGGCSVGGRVGGDEALWALCVVALMWRRWR